MRYYLKKGVEVKSPNFLLAHNGVFVIAEIGNNHNGCLSRAFKMIDAAKNAGADCVKFQMRHLDYLYRKKTLSRIDADLGAEYVLDLLDKFDFTIEQHKEVADYCRDVGIIYMCTAWDIMSVNILEDMGVLAYKVASADLTNMPLLDRLAKTEKPLILSTGMSKWDEVLYTNEFLKRKSVETVFLHCNSTYPAPFDDINLQWIPKMKEHLGCVGYSGHERGINVSIAAVALGAQVIEKHVTFDRNMEGPDHAASLYFDELAMMVRGIKQVTRALGDGETRNISQGELINRENLGKSLVAKHALDVGHSITEDDVLVLSPGLGLSPQRLSELVGKTLTRKMEAEDFFYETDLKATEKKTISYNFSRRWGIPVRFHDYSAFSDIVKPDLWEFHLSYKDLHLSPKKYVDANSGIGFVVHAPELFEDGELLDLASFDENYRFKSISNMNRVIAITRELTSILKAEKKPLIVTNIGGFSMDEKISIEAKKNAYQLFAKSLAELDLSGVELIPQTMAPFPWHFGGQRFQNLFVEAHEITMHCQTMKLNVCLDVSHSFLACKHLNQDFYKFCEQVAPYTAHIHIGDARGTNGEGLQIGDGDIDFIKLSKILKKGCPDASFIPEIWQGHKNFGEGFWCALEKLDGKL